MQKISANPDLPIEEYYLPHEFSVPGTSLSHPLSSLSFVQRPGGNEVGNLYGKKAIWNLVKTA